MSEIGRRPSSVWYMKLSVTVGSETRDGTGALMPPKALVLNGLDEAWAVYIGGDAARRLSVVGGLEEGNRRRGGEDSRTRSASPC